MREQLYFHIDFINTYEKFMCVSVHCVHITIGLTLTGATMYLAYAVN